MTDESRFSRRAARQEKRQKNKRKFLFFASLAIIFCVLLFSLIVLGNKDSDHNQVAEKEEGLKTEIKKTPEDRQEDVQPDEVNQGDEVEAVGDVEEVEIKEVESTDQNVIKAYVGDWEPVGTKQEGPHTTNYDEGSDDRIEIQQAVAIATGVNEHDMIEHWIGNGGDQKVIATIQDRTNNDYYRAYLTWIDRKGWQVTKIERINGFNSAKRIGTEEERDEG